MGAVEPTLAMWVVLALVASAIVAFSQSRIPIEFTALTILGALALFVHLARPEPAPGLPPYGVAEVFSGFANPALIAVISLLVVGQGLIATGALEAVSQQIFRLAKLGHGTALALALGCALLMSTVINDTPVVVMFIPILVALAERLRLPVNRFLMPLSYVAVLGGMTTLIGSGTNLLAAGAAAELGVAPLGFFDFTVPGLAIAAIAFPYAAFVAPRLLGQRRTEAETGEAEPAQQFVAHFQIAPGSKLVGAGARIGHFAELADMTVLLVSRDFRHFLPPFERLVLRAGDVVTAAATRKVLTEAFLRRHGIQPLAGTANEVAPTRAAGRPGTEAIAEAVIAPASQLVGERLVGVDLWPEYRCTVLGVKRRSAMTRAEIADYRLEPGDVLLIGGKPRDFRALRASHDILLLERSMVELPRYHHAWRAGLIFLAVVATVASGAAPTELAAFIGAVLMIASGCLNMSEAFRAVDRRVALIIAAAVGLGGALQATGAALYIAQGLLGALEGASPRLVLSALFILIAVFANVINAKACAVLFTPIAVAAAMRLNLDPLPFVVTVIFASNCCYATPIGHQANLLVMAPGRYRFADYLAAGTPLVLIVWVAFMLIVPWYYGLN